MPNYDTSYLIDQVKRRVSIPTSQQLFTNQKFVLMLNDELKTRIVPTLMALREDWYLVDQDTISDGVTTSFIIPIDAVGNKLKSITIWENSKQIRTITQLDKSVLQDAIYGFYIENNNVKFYPTPIQSGQTIRFSYFKRVDDLVETSEAGYISTVGALDVTISTTPPTTFITGASIQIVSNKNPFNIIWSGTITNVAGSVITLSSAPTNVLVGNWLCLSEQTTFPFIPIEMFPFLCQSVAVKCLESLGDTEGLNSAMASLQQIEYHCKQTLSPRIDDNPKRMISNNSIGRFI